MNKGLKYSLSNQLIMIENIVSNTTTKPNMLIYESNKKRR